VGVEPLELARVEEDLDEDDEPYEEEGFKLRHQFIQQRRIGLALGRRITWPTKNPAMVFLPRDTAPPAWDWPRSLRRSSFRSPKIGDLLRLLALVDGGESPRPSAKHTSKSCFSCLELILPSSSRSAACTIPAIETGDCSCSRPSAFSRPPTSLSSRLATRRGFRGPRRRLEAVGKRARSPVSVARPAAQLVLRNHARAARLGQLRQLLFQNLGQKLRANDQRRQVRLGEIAVVVRLLLRAHGVGASLGAFHSRDSCTTRPPDSIHTRSAARSRTPAPRG
jgi:hypothetical protein